MTTPRPPFKPTLTALFTLAFRPFFLMAALFSVLSLLLWGYALSDQVHFQPYGGLQFWHSHEMLFGFVGAVLAGFLLTAVQNWTGLRAVNGTPLILLVALWLAGRIVMAVPALPEQLVIFVDLLFFPAAAVFLLMPLLIRNQVRNYFAVLLLFLLMICNGISHFAVFNDDPRLQQQAFYCAALLITLMMAIIGGRIIPMFTANTTQIPANPRHQWLDRTALGLLWTVFAVSLLDLFWQTPAILLSLLFGVSGILLGWRCSHWRFTSTLAYPLLWSLQLGYWWIIIGLLLFSGHYAGFGIPASVALHSLTAGAMGMLILSMMSRVSLGHTGRPIIASRIMTISLLVLLAAALLRVFGAWLLPVFSVHLLQFSALLWGVAYGLFLVKFVPILSTSRADGKAE